MVPHTADTKKKKKALAPIAAIGVYSIAAKAVQCAVMFKDSGLKVPHGAARALSSMLKGASVDQMAQIGAEKTQRIV